VATVVSGSSAFSNARRMLSCSCRTKKKKKKKKPDEPVVGDLLFAIRLFEAFVTTPGHRVINAFVSGGRLPCRGPGCGYGAACHDPEADDQRLAVKHRDRKSRV